MTDLSIRLSEQARREIEELARSDPHTAEVTRSMMEKAIAFELLSCTKYPIEILVDGIYIPNRAAIAVSDTEIERYRPTSVKLQEEINRLSSQLQKVLALYEKYAKSYAKSHKNLVTKLEVNANNDFIDQARRLLNDDSFHPAVAAVMAGGVLERSLQIFCQSKNISLGSNQKPSIQSYASELRRQGYLTAQEVKDITAWSGTRNSAAHGEWDNVSDRKKISIMVDAIEHFLETKDS